MKNLETKLNVAQKPKFTDECKKTSMPKALLITAYRIFRLLISFRLHISNLN